MNFEVDLTGLGESVSSSLGSLTSIWLLPAGLIIAAGALSWGIAMLKSWRGRGA